MPQIALEPDLLSDFIIESQELLEEYTSNLLELENQPENQDIVSAVFRAAHTIKGSSAFFELDHIKNFAHKLENLLDKIRHEPRRISEETIGYLLNGGNHLKAMFDRTCHGNFSTQLTADESRFLTELHGYIDKREEPQWLPETALSAILSLTTEYRQGRLNAVQTLSQIGTIVLTSAPCLKRVDHKLSPTNQAPSEVSPAPGKQSYYFLGVDLTSPISRAMHLIQAALHSGTLDEEALDEALGTLSEIVRSHGLSGLESLLDEMIEDFKAVRDSAMEFDPLLLGLLKGQLEALIQRVETHHIQADATTVQMTEQITPKTKEDKKARAEPPTIRNDDKAERKTMRIPEEKVDGFMNCVGELIVTAETFNYLQKTIEQESIAPQISKAFKNANQAFRKLSGELQECLMEIRRVPIKGLLQRVNLVARDLAHQINKKVKVDILGQKVQLDKSIAEKLEGPLMHIVRNSLDHGFESPEAREKSGKPATGLLRVSASTDQEFFFLEIQDDGQGIDPRAVKNSAVKKGLITQDQARTISDREATNLIFAPGFSTADQITEVSGRGVGMDVVRTNIQQLNGSITLDSTPGLGTTISLKIPLSVTLQVIKAILVRVGQQPFLIPLENIIESLRLSSENLSTVHKNGEFVNIRGRILPLIQAL